MDAVLNPFSSGAGLPPPELIGRSEVLEDTRVLIGRLKAGRSVQSLLCLCGGLTFRFVLLLIAILTASDLQSAQKRPAKLDAQQADLKIIENMDLGDKYLKERRLDDAISYYRSAVMLESVCSDAGKVFIDQSKMSMGDALFQRAKEVLGRGDQKIAISLMKEASGFGCTRAKRFLAKTPKRQVSERRNAQVQDATTNTRRNGDVRVLNLGKLGFLSSRNV